MSGFLKALQKVGLVTVDSDGEEAVMLPVSEEPVPSEAAYQSTAGSQQCDQNPHRRSKTTAASFSTESGRCGHSENRF